MVEGFGGLSWRVNVVGLRAALKTDRRCKSLWFESTALRKKKHALNWRNQDDLRQRVHDA